MEFLLGIVILILDIWAIYSVLTSGVSTVSKLLWTIGILVFPVVGFIVWVLAGPKGNAIAT
ncbi:PLD nuclease N-terminal domain-containing protein [Caenibius sp. WL]|uniref:PLDc N-terminal domain-containing protein n=1 Tax=Caenibius sp. WL TaxID=2872646 RepID=UPI001C99D53F|nr:PLD nuclease N-terminal domain-containing protein [Caenibius sp. WL]QZP06691.1 PLD nuclease N-terminal domain-containing protein [Caenibius sp. WL]